LVRRVNQLSMELLCNVSVDISKNKTQKHMKVYSQEHQKMVRHKLKLISALTISLIRMFQKLWA
jgi:hypothetical protein